MSQTLAELNAEIIFGDWLHEIRESGVVWKLTPAGCIREANTERCPLEVIHGLQAEQIDTAWLDETPRSRGWSFILAADNKLTNHYLRPFILEACGLAEEDE